MSSSGPGRQDPLYKELYALSHRLDDENIKLIIGGGYGLLLRQQSVIERGERTLRPIPAARTTQDIDVFLSAELIANADQMSGLRDALEKLGYKPVDGAHYYQFFREIDYQNNLRSVKIDLLAPIPADDDALKKLKVDDRRIRLRAVKGIHAHTAPEALTVDEHLLELDLTGDLGPTNVYILHPYTFLILKLHAYRDRRESEATQYGEHHAFDLYRTLAMCTEPEWKEAASLRDRYKDQEPVNEARQIVTEYFSNEISSGTLAVHNGARSTGVDLLGREVLSFLTDLRELFPPI